MVELDFKARINYSYRTQSGNGPFLVTVHSIMMVKQFFSPSW
jgi:hypothetical protein